MTDFVLLTAETNFVLCESISIEYALFVWLFSGNGYNGNGFGAFVPQGLGGGPGIGQGIGPGIGQGIGQNNFNNFPLYGNQFNGPYNPGFGINPFDSIINI